MASKDQQGGERQMAQSKKRAPLSPSPLYKAIYDRLKSKLPVSVYDAALDDGAVFSHVTMDEDTADYTTKFFDSQELTHVVHIHSQFLTEVKDLIDQSIQALTAAPLNLGGGFRCVVHACDKNEIFRDLNGKIRHGVIVFRFKIESISEEVE